MKTCPNCKKKYDRALVLFDNSRMCPKCRKSLRQGAKKIDFRYNKENREQYRKAEVLYLECIKAISDQGGANALTREMVNKIKACKSFALDAFNLKNPEAAVLLSDYYFFRIDDFAGGEFEHSNDPERYNLAAYYLAAVLKDAKFEDDESHGEAANVNDDQHLIDLAGRKLKTVLTEIIKNQIPISAEELDSYIKTLNEAVPAYAIEQGDSSNGRNGIALISNLLSIDENNKVVGGLNDPTRPVDIAFICCTVADIKTAIEDKENYLSYYAKAKRSSDIYVYLYYYDGGVYHSANIRGKEDITGTYDLRSTDRVFLAVFDTGSKHSINTKYLPDDEVIDKTYREIIEDANSHDTSYIFTNDDIAFFKKGLFPNARKVAYGMKDRIFKNR